MRASDVSDVSDSSANKKAKQSHYENAPPMLVLTNEEKFKDDEGNVVEIEARGQREHNKIFFLLSDIEKIFDLVTFRVTLKSKTSDYIIEKDYKYFICSDEISNIIFTNKTQSSQKRIFVTYNGIIEILLNTKSPQNQNIQKMGHETLFTVQMGTQ